MDNRTNPKNTIEPAMDRGEAAADDMRDGMAEYAAGYNEPEPEPNPLPDSLTEHVETAGVSTTGEYAADDPVPMNITSDSGSFGSRQDDARSPSDSRTTKDFDSLFIPKGNTKTHGEIIPREPKSNGESKDKSYPKVPKNDVKAEGIPDEQMMDRDNKDSYSKIPEIPDTNIAVAFLVTVCFNLPLGLVAVYFSLMATKAFRDGKKEKGEKRVRISTYISLFSIVTTVLIVMVVVLLIAMKGQAARRRYSTKTSVSL